MRTNNFYCNCAKTEHKSENGFFLKKKQISAKNTYKARPRAFRSIVDLHLLNFQNSITVCAAYWCTDTRNSWESKTFAWLLCVTMAMKNRCLQRGNILNIYNEGQKCWKLFANGSVFDRRSVFSLMEKNLFHAARATHKVLPLLFKGKNNGKKGGGGWKIRANWNEYTRIGMPPNYSIDNFHFHSSTDFKRMNKKHFAKLKDFQFF